MWSCGYNGLYDSGDNVYACVVTSMYKCAFMHLHIVCMCVRLSVRKVCVHVLICVLVLINEGNLLCISLREVNQMTQVLHELKPFT